MAGKNALFLLATLYLFDLLSCDRREHETGSTQKPIAHKYMSFYLENDFFSSSLTYSFVIIHIYIYYVISLLADKIPPKGER